MYNNSLIENASIVPNLKGKYMFQGCTCARLLSFEIVGNGLVAIDCLINCLMHKKSKKKEWEFNHMFQDVWAIKFYWVETVMGLKGKMMYVKCYICDVVGNKDNLFIPKFDNF
jgi:hypothetical protein